MDGDVETDADAPVAVAGDLEGGVGHGEESAAVHEAVDVRLVRSRHEPRAGASGLPVHDLDADEAAEADVAQDGVEAVAQVGGQLAQGLEPSQACHDSGSTHALKRRLSRFLNGWPV